MFHENALQVAAAYDNKGAVRLLLEKGFVFKNQNFGIIEATSGSTLRQQATLARRQWILPSKKVP